MMKSFGCISCLSDGNSRMALIECRIDAGFSAANPLAFCRRFAIMLH